MHIRWKEKPVMLWVAYDSKIYHRQMQRDRTTQSSYNPQQDLGRLTTCTIYNTQKDKSHHCTKQHGAFENGRAHTPDVHHTLTTTASNIADIEENIKNYAYEKYRQHDKRTKKNEKTSALGIFSIRICHILFHHSLMKFF